MSTFYMSTVLTTAQRDLALATWYALGMLGCEEEAIGEDVRVRVFFAEQAAARAASDELGTHGALTPPVIGELEDQDWNARWRESMKPARIAPRFWVSPAWLTPPLKAGDRWIKIEPKMAFGTGHHESTRLAARGLIHEMRRRPARRVLDIGSGSGVLCFVADMCGAAFCAGVEVDPECRENLAENRAQNRAEGVVGFVISTLDSIREGSRFDVIVMNMILAESAPLLEAVSALLEQGGRLVWSGLLNDQKQKAAGSAAAAGLSLLDDRAEHEWWCGTFSGSRVR